MTRVVDTPWCLLLAIISCGEFCTWAAGRTWTYLHARSPVLLTSHSSHSLRHSEISGHVGVHHFATSEGSRAHTPRPLAGLILGSLLTAGVKRRLRRSVRAALPDGTNDEGEDLPEPLGMKLVDVSDVVVYGNEFSPPAQKIMTMLNFYGVSFKLVKGRHPTSDYKKIPVLELNGRQVNDSHIIVKNLAEVLTGDPLTPLQLQWERKITFEFQPSIEVELFSNGDDFAKLAGFDDWRKPLVGLAGPVLGLLIGNVFRSRYGDFPVPSTWGKRFLEACAGQPFFHGEKPGMVDLSLYGTYANIASKDCQCTRSFLEESGLQSWHLRMVDATKSASQVKSSAMSENIPA
eukprot:TRINITY_DN50674_c0_g1_i1.p1 TRINITY_DN50674_c0_g1~~TRINITY_DN50674_c0_g1_i1.p1  ORF type:complete len:347 (-),score=55.64 TRINITY_DN50674_c0_g1_i1:167-1207(-)